MLEQKPNSEQKDETLDSSSPNGTNALVVGLPSLSESYYKSDLSTRKIVDTILKELTGLSIVNAKRTIRIASHCLYTTSEKIESEIFV